MNLSHPNQIGNQALKYLAWNNEASSRIQRNHADTTGRGWVREQKMK